MGNLRHRLACLLERFSLAQITKEEENELWSLLNDGRYDDDVRNILAEMMQSENPSVETDSTRWAPLFKKVMEQKDASDGPGIQPSGNVHWFSWKKMAAASVILVIGAGLYFLSGNENTGAEIAVRNVEVLRDVAPPNSVNATLTLSDGNTIILDSAGNGKLAQQGGVNVLKLNDGQIEYNDAEAAGNREIVLYNTLSNPRGSKAVNIVLADGSRVWLNAESSLTFPTAFTGKERRVEITGEAYFEVAHNKAKPFFVHVDGMEVKVLGTHFNINTYKEERVLKTSLLEGSVRISKDGVSAVIKPGDQAQVSRSGDNSINIVRPDLKEVMAWKDGRFMFNDMDLETIMREMARWYNVEVVYKNKITDRYTVDVSRDVPVSQLFKFIEMSGGVSFDIQNNVITVKK